MLHAMWSGSCFYISIRNIWRITVVEISDELNAFKETFSLLEQYEGALSGMTVGVKDLFDIGGKVTGCGNPDWYASHLPAEKHAYAVEKLLSNGAEVAGKTHTDELAYSLLGNNFHYGMPYNSAAPGRMTGGSSSGSAAAVAGGLVDIGLGTDTGGSVRIPSSFCGLYGLRTTHGRVSLEGCMPLAHSFDTVGWMTRGAELLLRVGRCFDFTDGAVLPDKLLFPADAWALIEDGVKHDTEEPVIAISSLFAGKDSIVMAENGLQEWRQVFQTCQAAEIWQNHGKWIREHKPLLGPGVKERIATAETVTDAQWKEADQKRQEIRWYVRKVLEDGVLILPTSPTYPLLREASTQQQQVFRDNAFAILCIAGLSGCPQITLPVKGQDGPVGISLIGPPNSDLELIELALKLW